MQREDYFEFLGPDQIRIKGHRIGIEHVIERYQEGASPEQIALTFPGLSLEAIEATITHYLHHRESIDAYLARQHSWMRRAMAEDDAREPLPAMARIRALLEERERALLDR